MIQRTILTQIKPWLKKRPFIILKGARRVGKTTILKHIFAQTKGAKAFLICDTFQLQAFLQTPADLIFYLTKKYNFSAKQPFWLFLDEFQYLPQAGLFLKNLYDLYPHLKIIASGSSSLEITKNTEFLTGRSVQFLMSPLSFYEFFVYRMQQKVKPEEFTTFAYAQKFFQLYAAELKRFFLEYLAWGGYPEVVLEPAEKIKQRILAEYIARYIEKDIVHFLKIENITAFNNLLKLLASNIGQLINLNEIANTLGTAYKTIQKYTAILEGSFLIKRIPPFYKNIRSEVSKMPKIYFTDLGVRNALLGRNESLLTAIDLGNEVENFVFQIFQTNCQKIYFYRTISGSEIDFVLEAEPYSFYEVKYRNKLKSILAYKNFAKKYPLLKTRKTVITKNLLTKKDEITYIPASLFGLFPPLNDL